MRVNQKVEHASGEAQDRSIKLQAAWKTLKKTGTSADLQELKKKTAEQMEHAWMAWDLARVTELALEAAHSAVVAKGNRTGNLSTDDHMSSNAATVANSTVSVAVTAEEVGDPSKKAQTGGVGAKIELAQEEKLLELMRDAARDAGGAQPRRGPGGNPTGARGLIKECQTTWESYCEKPGKTRLKKVFSTLKKMETSKATTVKAERSRCLRSARAEDRKHGYGLT
jgi:hypothetical protein